MKTIAGAPSKHIAMMATIDRPALRIGEIKDTEQKLNAAIKRRGLSTTCSVWRRRRK